MESGNAKMSQLLRVGIVWIFANFKVRQTKCVGLIDTCWLQWASRMGFKVCELVESCGLYSCL